MRRTEPTYCRATIPAAGIVSCNSLVRSVKWQEVQEKHMSVTPNVVKYGLLIMCNMISILVYGLIFSLLSYGQIFAGTSKSDSKDQIIPDTLK